MTNSRDFGLVSILLYTFECFSFFLQSFFFFFFFLIKWLYWKGSLSIEIFFLHDSALLLWTIWKRKGARARVPKQRRRREKEKLQHRKCAGTQKWRKPATPSSQNDLISISPFRISTDADSVSTEIDSLRRTDFARFHRACQSFYFLPLNMHTRTHARTNVLDFV